MMMMIATNSKIMVCEREREREREREKTTNVLTCIMDSGWMSVYSKKDSKEKFIFFFIAGNRNEMKRKGKERKTNWLPWCIVYHMCVSPCLVGMQVIFSICNKSTHHIYDKIPNDDEL